MISLRPLVLAHAPSKARADLSTLFELDDMLGRILASTTEPMIGQMRLTWWHDRLTALKDHAAPPEPLLAALKGVVERHDIEGAAVAAMVNGWEALLDPMPLDQTALRQFADGRGAQLFAIAAQLFDTKVEKNMGAAWAAIDFAMHCSDRTTAMRAHELARRDLASHNISGPKPLKILAHIARAKANQSPDHVTKPVSRWMILNAVLR